MSIINIKESQLWSKYHSNGITLWLKGYVFSHSIEDLATDFLKATKENIHSLMREMDGHYAIVIKMENVTYVCVDKIRSIPLFVVQKGDTIVINDNAENLINDTKLDRSNKNTNGKLSLSMSGFTIGSNTLFEALISPKAGEILVFSANRLKSIQYYKYFSNELSQKNEKALISDLSELTLKILKKHLNSIGDRQIIVPLSAGNDSRLIVSGLKYLGANNVKCYSYGTEGNFEAEISKKIANKLNYEWIFVPLTHASEKFFYSSSTYQEFLKFSESHCATPYIQSLSTIKYLKELKYIDSDAVFINGNSGDFISGGHVTESMQADNSEKSYSYRKELILDSLIKKHFSLWGYLKTSDNIKDIKNQLWEEITAGCGELSDVKFDHMFYEYSELIDRQSKYVIAGQRAYEFYGHEWRLPLWDNEYLDFWNKVPLSFKANQNLYISMLKEKNWAEVWDDSIPVNKKTIRPEWIIPLRLILKMPFALFGIRGKKAWHQFEINFLYYWMDVTHMIDTTKYSRIIMDIFKKPRNHVSWHTEDYLNRHNK